MKEYRQPQTNGFWTILQTVCWTGVVLIGFYLLTRHGNRIWALLRPALHYLLVAAAVSWWAWTVRRPDRPNSRPAATRSIPYGAMAALVLSALLLTGLSATAPRTVDDAVYRRLLEEVVRQRDWLRSDEGQRASYHEKLRILSEADREFGEILHEHPNDGRVWLLRGILTRIRPDLASEDLDPLCFEEAASCLAAGADLDPLFHEDERWFYEEAALSLLELGHRSQAVIVAQAAPNEDWATGLRSEVRRVVCEEPHTAESAFPTRARIGRIAEIVGFGAVEGRPEIDPRRSLELFAGDSVILNTSFRFRRKFTLHPACFQLACPEGINGALPISGVSEIEGAPGEVVVVPLKIELPPFYGPLRYSVSLVFEEPWDFPAGPLTVPLTELEVLPRLTQSQAPDWKMEDLYGGVPYRDLGFRTTVGPERGVVRTLEAPVLARGVVIVSGLSYGGKAAPRETVAEVRITGRGSGSWTLPLRAGVETAEIYADNPGGASDRGEAAIWTSYPANSGEGTETFEAHHYHARIDFDRPVEVAEVGLGVAEGRAHFLNVFHVLLIGVDE